MRINLQKSLFILPNLFTLSSVFCGFYAVVLCASNPVEDDFYRAALLIIYAMFFDTIDGRVARLTKTQSAFGVEIDSLADVVSFGVAPAVLVYTWALSPLGFLGVVASFMYVACGAIRLARFNVMVTVSDGKPKKPSKYFSGLPIPGAAGILVSMVAANHVMSGHLYGSRIPIVVLVVALSVFMVSTIQFRSFKDMKLNWRTMMLISTTLAASVAIAIEYHISFALGWMLASYVAIGLIESIFNLSRRAMRRGRPAEDEETAPS